MGRDKYILEVGNASTLKKGQAGPVDSGDTSSNLAHNLTTTYISRKLLKFRIPTRNCETQWRRPQSQQQGASSVIRIRCAEQITKLSSKEKSSSQGTEPIQSQASQDIIHGVGTRETHHRTPKNGGERDFARGDAGPRKEASIRIS